MSAESPASFVYCLAHREQPRFKVGKANNVLERARVLGMSEFNFGKSFALQLPDENRAFEVERSIHRLLSPWRIDPQRLGAAGELPSQGFTEWFELTAMPHARTLMEMPLMLGSIVEGKQLSHHAKLLERVTRKQTSIQLARAADPSTDQDKRLASFLHAIELGKLEWPTIIQDCRAKMDAMRSSAVRFAYADQALFMQASADTFAPLRKMGQELATLVGRICVRSRNGAFPTILFTRPYRPVVNAKHFWLRQVIGFERPTVEVGSHIQLLQDYDSKMADLLQPFIRQLFDQWVAPFDPPIEGWDAGHSDNTIEWVEYMEANWLDQK